MDDVFKRAQLLYDKYKDTSEVAVRKNSMEGTQGSDGKGVSSLKFGPKFSEIKEPAEKIFALTLITFSKQVSAVQLL